ncbi:hypothetical protein QDX81_15555 [Pseudomonas sp. CW003PS]|nr:hypothetical protein QDX81_15555 [Pseudomonas sp. CW003PS]
MKPTLTIEEKAGKHVGKIGEKKRMGWFGDFLLLLFSLIYIFIA